VEKNYWSKAQTIESFTAGVNVYQRIDCLKIWMTKELLKRDTPLADCVKMILDFTWLELIQKPENSLELMIK
jgi:hypothetical protein